MARGAILSKTFFKQQTSRILDEINDEKVNDHLT